MSNSYGPGFKEFDWLIDGLIPYSPRNPILDTYCPAGIFVHIVSHENTTNEAETVRFLKGAADYRP